MTLLRARSSNSYLRLIYARGVSRPGRVLAGMERELGRRRKWPYKYTITFDNPSASSTTRLMSANGSDID